MKKIKLNKKTKAIVFGSLFLSTIAASTSIIAACSSTSSNYNSQTTVYNVSKNSQTQSLVINPVAATEVFNVSLEDSIKTYIEFLVQINNKKELDSNTNDTVEIKLNELLPSLLYLLTSNGISDTSFLDSVIKNNIDEGNYNLLNSKILANVSGAPSISKDELSKSISKNLGVILNSFRFWNNLKLPYKDDHMQLELIENLQANRSKIFDLSYISSILPKSNYIINPFELASKTNIDIKNSLFAYVSRLVREAVSYNDSKLYTNFYFDKKFDEKLYNDSIPMLLYYLSQDNPVDSIKELDDLINLQQQPNNYVANLFLNTKQHYQTYELADKSIRSELQSIIWNSIFKKQATKDVDNNEIKLQIKQILADEEFWNQIKEPYANNEIILHMIDKNFKENQDILFDHNLISYIHFL